MVVIDESSVSVGLCGFVLLCAHCGIALFVKLLVHFSGYPIDGVDVYLCSVVNLLVTDVDDSVISLCCLYDLPSCA